MDDIERCRHLFYNLADPAVSLGVISKAERELLARSGSVKTRYWCGNFDRLLTVLQRRLPERFFDSRLDPLRRAVSEYTEGA